MSELFTIDEIERYLREEVMRAGGAKKWCRKNKVYMDHALHLVQNGSAASLDQVVEKLGFRKVLRFEPLPLKAENGHGCQTVPSPESRD